MPGGSTIHAALAGDGRCALETRREGATLVVQVERTVEYFGGSAQDFRSGGRDGAHVMMIQTHATHSMHLAGRLDGLAFLGNGHFLGICKITRFSLIF